MGTTENTEFTERAGHDPPRLLYSKLTAGIRQVAYDVHAYFGPGFLEKVYENALANRLHNAGYQVAQQASLKVRDFDGAIVGQYVADIVVDNRILVEVKAVSTLTHNHQAQILNYLKATGFRVGLLLDFACSRLQVKRFVL